MLVMQFLYNYYMHFMPFALHARCCNIYFVEFFAVINKTCNIFFFPSFSDVPSLTCAMVPVYPCTMLASHLYIYTVIIRVLEG